MREQVTIELQTPIVTHDGPLKKIVFREPSFDEVMKLDSPYVVAGAHDGTPFVAVDMEIVRKYVELLVVEPKDSALLSQANGKVALKVREAILGFFQPDAVTVEDLPTSQTTSPSTASGSAQTQSET